ncbi:hypothetical protein BRD06_02540 [Halobacteriales archaeon QS_9_67_15]|nr:MAG: hypothetical protein BRD06_02540 [Halobacteriales archaeon QS_9_67_15]
MEVRDAYNNPVSGVSVTASPSWASGSSTATSNEAGRAAFVFEIPDDAGGLDDQVNVSLGSNPPPTPFDPETAENVGLAVTVLDTSVSGTGGGDGTGPDVISQDVTPDPVEQGETVTLTATIDDVERGGLDVIEAEWFRVAPGETIAGQDPGNGSANPMSVVDGEWNQPTEDVTDTATASWEPGDHEIVFRGRDANGNWGPTRTATVTVKPRVMITAAEPDPEKLPDSDGEFVQLEVPTGVDTSGWVLTDTESGETRQTISNVDGTVYFARNPSAFADQWDGVDASDVEPLNIGFMNNGGDSVELRDDSGTVVDRFAYKGPTFDDGSTFTFNSGTPRQVAYRTQSGGNYVDTDSESDWDEEGECAFFGGGNGCSLSGAFESAGTTALLPDIGQQRQTFTFTPDTQIPSGTQIEINLDDPQQQSPLQVDYQGNVNTNVSTGNTNSNTNGDTAFLTITPNRDIAAGETVRVWTDKVRTGSDGQYDVTFTRGDSGVSTTTTFDVGRDTGDAEIRNFEATNLVPDTSSQQQTFTFTLDSDLDGGERINIGLSPAESPDDVSYQGISSVNVSTGNTNFNKNNGRAWVLIEAPSSGLSAGTGVEVVVNANTDQMTGSPYEVGITRGDADTTSTMFDAANNPAAIQFSNFQGFTANTTSDEFTLEDIQVQDADSDDDLDRIVYEVTDSDGNVVASETVTGIGPAQYQPGGSPAVTITGDPIQEGETYALTATAYDADGNFDSRSASDTAPSSPTVTIDSATHDPNTKDNNRRHTIDVTFTGSDPDSDLSSYTVTVYNNSSQSYVVGSQTASYFGGQMSVLISDTKQGNGNGDDPYYVVVEVTDSTGLTDSATATTTSIGGGATVSADSGSTDVDPVVDRPLYQPNATGDYGIGRDRRDRDTDGEAQTRLTGDVRAGTGGRPR